MPLRFSPLLLSSEDDDVDEPEDADDEDEEAAHAFLSTPSRTFDQSSKQTMRRGLWGLDPANHALISPRLTLVVSTAKPSEEASRSCLALVSWFEVCVWVGVVVFVSIENCGQKNKQPNSNRALTRSFDACSVVSLVEVHFEVLLVEARTRGTETDVETLSR